MIATRHPTRTQFYREFLMRRGNFNPADFGVDMEREEFSDQILNEFNTIYRGGWTIDELCLHPDEAKHFCVEVRRKFGYYDLPDDIILRVIMTRRKNPNA
jgi:hypothetical protein